MEKDRTELPSDVQAQERRRQAVERLTRLEVEDPPDPATLARQLDEAHDPGIPN